MKMKIDHKEFEKKIFSILKEMSIVPKGYYTYPDFTDLVGQQNPSWPLTLPLKVMAEIFYGKIKKENITGFIKSAKDNQATRFLVFGITDLNDLKSDILNEIVINNIEYFGLHEIEKLISVKSISQNIQTYKKASEVVAPTRLINGMSDFAQQKIPSDILTALNAAMPDNKIQAWEIFEEAVCAAFKYCLGCEVRQLGKERRFQNEPEGVGIIDGQNRRAFLYECKSSKSAYKMSLDDVRIYVDYIQSKKKIISVTDNADLRYFIIIAPQFAGDKENRRNEIHHKTGVLTAYIKSDTLKRLAKWACTVDEKHRKLIDISEIFSKISDNEISDKTVDVYCTKFDQEYKQRY